MITKVFLAALFTSINFSFKDFKEDGEGIGRYLFGWIRNLTAVVYVASFLVYFGLPSSTGPLFGGMNLIVMLLLLSSVVMTLVPRSEIWAAAITLVTAITWMILKNTTMATISICCLVIFIILAGAHGAIRRQGRKAHKVRFLGHSSFWEDLTFKEFAGIVGPMLIWGVIIGLPGLASLGYVDEKAAMIGDVNEGTWDKGLSPTDENHIRWVAYETILFRAGEAISKNPFPRGTGSRYGCPRAYVQKHMGEIVGVVPLEYLGIFKWQHGAGTPGYMIVSVENPDHMGTPVMEANGEALNLRCMPSAFYEDNLFRHVYKEHPEVLLLDATFELEEPSGYPWWVISACERTLSYTGREVTFLLLVDPQTMEIKRVELDELEQYPWIDRVLPESVALDYVSWYGKYADKEGSDWDVWWNGNFKKDGVLTATALTGDTDLTLVWGEEGAQWYTGLTSSNAKEKALEGFLLLDARTRLVNEYDLNGGRTEDRALALVRLNLDRRVGNIGPARQAIPHNINGIAVYVIPVINLKPSESGTGTPGNEGAPVGYAIVPVTGKEFVAYGESPRECLADFRVQLQKQGQGAAVVSSIAQLKRIPFEVDSAWELADGQRVIYPVGGGAVGFIGMPSTALEMIELGSIKSGDMVDVAFSDTSLQLVQIQAVDNRRVNIYKMPAKKAAK